MKRKFLYQKIYINIVTLYIKKIILKGIRVIYRVRLK